MPLKYNPAGDSLVLAYNRWLEGSVKESLMLVTAAFELAGIKDIIDGIDTLNSKASITAANELLTEDFDETLERGATDPLEKQNYDIADQGELEEEDNKVEAAIQEAIAELEDEDEELYLDDEEEGNEETEEEEEDGEEDGVQEEDKEDKEEKIETSSSYMEHIALCNRVSLNGDKGHRIVAKRLLQSAQ